MLGKAVKIRHCPATVSAPCRVLFCSGRNGPERKPTGAVLREGNPHHRASQETGPVVLRHFQQWKRRYRVPRGTEDSMTHLLRLARRSLLFVSTLLFVATSHAVTVHGT